ncbi:Camk1 [Symbiodinium sp. CCMP2592]|nr:Camk1 [Symbiodinium sp. CCMP2592]
MHAVKPGCCGRPAASTDGAGNDSRGNGFSEVLNFSSCAYHQVADFMYCHCQQRQDWQLFSAARMLQQAGILVLLCTGCSSAWPLPFTLSDLWHNLYRSIDWAVKTMEMARSGPPSPGSARLFVRALSSCQIWETEEPPTSMDPEQKPWLPDEAEGKSSPALAESEPELTERSDDAEVRVLSAVRSQKTRADREAANGNLREALRLYDDASSILLSLQDASTEGALKAVDLRVEALNIRLMAAKALSLLGDWFQAEARASKALEAATFCPGGEELAELTELGIASEASTEGTLVHRDAAEALLCRARARLKLGNAAGAREDAAKARNLFGQLQDQLKQEAADGFLMQAQMVIAASGHDPKTLSQSCEKSPASGPLQVHGQLQDVETPACSLPAPLSKMPRPEEIVGLLEEMD